MNILERATRKRQQAEAILADLQLLGRVDRLEAGKSTLK